ncbi:T9SS type A sorting domain-containing protein [Candidatus Poribacteria bacterium]|nr:T9SS type A sorting domain-containing protein [Candidatus Poribacteria bacterium]MYK21422.1 T9SS type A sorting domain-containing protein [Candidatus Poribacteria bacterium]
MVRRRNLRRLQITILTLLLGIGLAGQSSADRVQLNTSAAVIHDNLGASVGMSGDYAMVGVPKDDTDDGRNAGSIQVFFRSETGWVQHQKLNASDTIGGDELGTTLAMSGDYAIVGAPRKDDFGNNSGAAYIFTRQGTEWVEQTKLVAPDARAGDYFGISVAIDGDTALVGAHRINKPTADAGSVYVFERLGNSWIQTAHLTAPDATKFAYFGFSVGIDEDTAIIGATRDDEAGSDAGAAYVFVRKGVQWTFQEKLLGNNTESDDNFGYAVDVDGDFAIVTSPKNKGGGAAYIYQREGTKWQQKRNRVRIRMIPIDPDGASAFGTSVDINGETAVIGAIGGKVGQDLVGAAYVFTRNEPPFWNQHTKLVSSDSRGGDQLGFAVAISGSEVIAGAPKHSAGGLASGAAYIYEQKEDGAWIESIKLSDGETASEDQFGISVAISGNFAISGAQQDDDIAPNAGAAYVFERSGTLWLQRAKFTANDAKAGDLFGNTVSINGETVVIGAPGVDDVGPESGAAYVFIYSGDEWIQQAKLIGDDTSMFDHFGTAVAIHENTVIIGAHGKDEGAEDSGAAYIFVRNAGSWIQQAKLAHQNPVPGDQFGRAVAVYEDNALIGAHRSDATGPDSGAAYIFTRNGGTWRQDFQLIPNDSGLGDEFGYAVDLTGGVAIIGAPKEDRSEPDMGAAYIFVETRTDWLQQAKLTAIEAEAGDEFGAAVAIHQDTAVVGAWKDDHPAPESGDQALVPLQVDKGSAYSFLRDGLTWVPKRRIVASGTNRSDIFGASVAIRGAFAIVGAAGNDNAGDNAGSAFIYNPIDLGFQAADVPFRVDPASQTLTTLGHIKHTTVFQNYPNPFNPETWFPYNLAEHADVTVKIYDIAGGLVRQLNVGLQEPGNYQSQDRAAYWDGRDESGTQVASGIYFYTFTAGDFQSTRRMVILK